MIERRKKELELVEAKYGLIEVSPNLDWFIINAWDLIPGWNKTQTRVLVLLAPGYPTTAPDNFYTDNDLRLANGTVPGNTSPGQSVAGGQWLQFSYHIQAGDWQPHADPLQGHNMLTFLEGVAARLKEVS